MVVQPWRQRYWLHGLLFVLTIFTTIVVGARLEYNFLHNLAPLYDGEDGLAIFPLAWAVRPENFVLGIPFSLTLMLILLAHEMGHYLYCRRYGVWATLPFFIPFPTLIGTLGAFIRIRSPIRSRTALFDIGVAGPIAGFVVAFFVLCFSLGLSRIAGPPTGPAIDLKYPLVFYWVHHALGALSPGYSLRAIPLSQLHLHPVAIAAWVGMFATALNLLPGGQLDGGHMVFSLAPPAHKLVSRLTILALLPLAYYRWVGWLLWSILLAISGLRHPVVPPWPGVERGRYAIGIFALLMLVLTFSPAPFAHASLREVIREFSR